MNNMVVGLVTTGFDKGGLEQVVFNLYEGYRSCGVKAYILCQDGNLMGNFAALLHDVRDFCIFEDSVETFLAFCYRKQITHLHYHHNISFIEQARECGIQTIYTIHNAYTWFDNATIQRRRVLLEKCDNVIAVSSFAKNYFCARSGMHPDCVGIIPNGIDLQELTTSPKLPKYLTKEGMGLAEDDIVFAQVASFTLYKHQIGLVGIMEEVIKENPHIKLILVGGILDKEYYSTFLNELNVSPAKKNIICIDYFDHMYMGEFLRKTVDVAVLATLQEGCSNYVLEAMACKLPMILTKVGNAEDIQAPGISVIDPAFSDISTLSYDELKRIAYKKKNINTSALAMAFLDTANNLKGLKKLTDAWDEQIKSIDTTYMVNAYLSILEKLDPCFE